MHLVFLLDLEACTRILAALVKPAQEAVTRSRIDDYHQGAAQPQIDKHIDQQPHAFQVSTATLKPDQVNQITEALESQYGLARPPDSQSVGPTFGNSVANSAIIAIIASLFVISCYIALRFEWKYAVPVLIAVMH